MSTFLTYKKFQHLDQAQDLMDVLKKNHIDFEIEDNSRDMAEFFIGQDIENNVHLKIHPANFERANELFNQHAIDLMDGIDKEYYLFSFEHEELLEIIKEPDAWSELDVQLAKKILKDKGIHISPELEKSFHQQRMEELTASEKPNPTWIIIGYLSAFLGGLIGIGIGITLWTSKKTLPNGERVYTYAENERKHGRIMCLIGIFMLVILLYLQLNQSFFLFSPKHPDYSL